MQETWVSFLGQEEPLEKGIATHSIIIAWEIPWTLEPGRLQSMGLQKSWACLVTTQQHLKKKKKIKLSIFQHFPPLIAIVILNKFLFMQLWVYFFFDTTKDQESQHEIEVYPKGKKGGWNHPRVFYSLRKVSHHITTRLPVTSLL